MAIPKGTMIPKPNQFMKIQEGVSKFRVLSDIVTGWEGWKDKVVTRHPGDICKIKVEDVELDKYGKPSRNYFWAVVVWNYKDKMIQTLQIKQSTVMGMMSDLEEGGEWGDLKEYDLTVTGKKEAGKTSYTVIPSKPAPLALEIAELYKNTDIDLNKLFEGKYPQETVETGAEDYGDFGEDVPNVPFD